MGEVAGAVTCPRSIPGPFPGLVFFGGAQGCCLFCPAAPGWVRSECGCCLPIWSPCTASGKIYIVLKHSTVLSTEMIELQMLTRCRTLFFIIKNVISCFAHDKTHQINLLGAELPWARLEARTALAAREHVARDRGCPAAQPPPGTTRVTLPAVQGMAVSPRASVSPFTSGE